MIKIYDDLAVVVSTTAVTTTASTTGVNIDGLAVGENTYAANINITSVTGTVDGSNYYSIQLEASDAIGGTYAAVGNPINTSVVGAYTIAFASEQLPAGADYFRVTCTKVGTTATGISYGCYLTLAS